MHMAAKVSPVADVAPRFEELLLLIVPRIFVLLASKKGGRSGEQ